MKKRCCLKFAEIAGSLQRAEEDAPRALCGGGHPASPGRQVRVDTNIYIIYNICNIYNIYNIYNICSLVPRLVTKRLASSSSKLEEMVPVTVDFPARHIGI